MESTRSLSLLDLANCSPRNYVLVYAPFEHRLAWWTRWLSQRFAHVDVWLELDEDLWLCLSGSHAYISIELINAPIPKEYVVQRVTARRRDDVTLNPLGLKTCVSMAKAMLGIRKPFILTPLQLYNYVKRSRGLV